MSLYHGDEEKRFLLGKAGRNPIAIIGLNPSKATDVKNDPTMRSVERLIENFPTQDYAFDGFLMLNLYPLRATNPKDLPALADSRLLRENLRQIEKALVQHKVRTIWAAWGNNIRTRRYLAESLQDLTKLSERHGVTWRHCSQLTKLRHPRHPLYLKSGSCLSIFDVKNYLRVLNA